MRANLSQVCKRRDRAGEIGRAAADLDLAPAGLAAQRDEQALVQELDPAGAVVGLIADRQSRPTISERRRPPAKPSSRMARSRRPRRSASGRVSSMAIRSAGMTASFCAGGRPCLRRIPASTVAIWRSARSSGVPFARNAR